MTEHDTPTCEQLDERLMARCEKAQELIEKFIQIYEGDYDSCFPPWADLAADVADEFIGRCHNIETALREWRDSAIAVAQRDAIEHAWAKDRPKGKRKDKLDS